MLPSFSSGPLGVPYPAITLGIFRHALSNSRNRRALTRVKLLFSMAVIALLLWILLPAIAHYQERNRVRVHCANKLKNIGFAFRDFATDNNDAFPQQLSTNQGGVRELVDSGLGGTGDPTRTFWIFVAMSNNLATPKTLVCPYDKHRAPISNFIGMVRVPLAQGGQNAALSYFVNLDANERQPQAILAGDRNLSPVSNAKRASDYDAFFSVERRIRPANVKPGGIYANLDFHQTIHGDKKTGLRVGNMLLADGSVRPVTGTRVCDHIIVSTNDHRLIFPFMPGKNE